MEGSPAWVKLETIQLIIRPLRWRQGARMGSATKPSHSSAASFASLLLSARLPLPFCFRLLYGICTVFVWSVLVFLLTGPRDTCCIDTILVQPVSLRSTHSISPFPLPYFVLSPLLTRPALPPVFRPSTLTPPKRQSPLEPRPGLIRPQLPRFLLPVLLYPTLLLSPLIAFILHCLPPPPQLPLYRRKPSVIDVPSHKYSCFRANVEKARDHQLCTAHLSNIPLHRGTVRVFKCLTVCRIQPSCFDFGLKVVWLAIS